MGKPANNELLDLLKIALVNNTQGKLDLSVVQPYLNKYVSLRVIHKGEYIAHLYETIEKISLIIEGEFFIVRNSLKGRTNMIAKRKAPQFVGTIQALSKHREFASNIIASKKCVILEFDCAYFRQNLIANGEAAMIIIEDMADIVMRGHARMDRLVFNDSVDNLMEYIYTSWLENGKNKGPYVIKDKNAIIADAMGISTRTLYRSLNHLKEQNLISVVDGCIVVSEEQISIIREKCVFF